MTYIFVYYSLYKKGIGNIFLFSILYFAVVVVLMENAIFVKIFLKLIFFTHFCRTLKESSVVIFGERAVSKVYREKNKIFQSSLTRIQDLRVLFIWVSF